MSDPVPLLSAPPIRDVTQPLAPPPAATVPPVPYCTALPHRCPCDQPQGT